MIHEIYDNPSKFPLLIKIFYSPKYFMNINSWIMNVYTGWLRIVLTLFNVLCMYNFLFIVNGTSWRMNFTIFLSYNMICETAKVKI